MKSSLLATFPITMQNNAEAKGLDNDNESSHTLLLVETATCDVETHKV